MIKKIIAIIFLGLVLSACSVSTQEESVDSVILERYGMFTMPEYAFQKITITKEGILYETFNYDNNKTGETFTEFNSDEFENLVKTLNSANFKNLDDTYNSETPVADVGAGKITIKYGSSTKIIEVDPYIQHGNNEQIVKIIGIISEVTQNAKFPQIERPPIVTLKYEGKQCIEEPWEVWYSKGEINYIVEPSSEQLILDYYSNKEIGIYEIRTLNHDSVCEACEVCVDYEYYEVDIYENELENFLNESWVLIE